MAAIIPGFNAAEFRDGIHTAMVMGMPPEEARQPRFVIEGPRTAAPERDADGVPWDMTQEMLPAPENAVKVPCAIEWTERSEETRAFGPLQPGAVEITLLDVDYALVEGFSYVELWPTLSKGPVRYYYRRVLLQTSLDIVGVWTLECATEDTV